MDDPHRIDGQYIVRFYDDEENVERLIRELIARARGEKLAEFRHLKGFWAKLPSDAIAALAADPRVRYIEADVAMTISGVGDTTQVFPTGPLDRMDQRNLPLDQSYQWSTDGTGVHIWIVDNGVDITNQELVGRVSTAHYSTFQGQDPFAGCATNPHGTLMAMAAAGRTVGIARNATIHSARVNQPGNCQGISVGAASGAMEYIADYSPRPAVINYSAAGPCNWYGCGNTVDDAASYAHDRGVTVVVAAGNHDSGGLNACDFAPAHMGKLLTVGAVGLNDVRELYSNYGSCVDVFATVNAGGGTSTATAYASGVAALELQMNPSLPPSWVQSKLLFRATPGVLSSVGTGSPNLLLYTRRLPFSLVFHGYDILGPQTSCSWSVEMVGGQPPYSVEWKRDGVSVSNVWDYWVSQAGASSFGLTVSATDGVGRSAQTGRFITVDPLNYDSWCGGF